MIRTLRAFFLMRLLREKILILIFLLIGVAVWLSNFTGRVGRFSRSAHSTTVQLKDQSMWLSKREEIEAAAQAAAGHLDVSKTLDGTRLLAEVTAMAGDAGLHNTASGEIQDVSNGQFSIHTLRFQVSKAEWEPMQTFYLALRKRSPYIGITQFTLNADRGNPRLLNAVLRVSSVEIIRN